jgi:hypothetical protein
MSKRENFDLTTNTLEQFATEGSPATADLCKMAELMGYKESGGFAINQLQCSNGAFVSSLLRFFEDNPGAIEAVHDWVHKNYKQDMEEAREEACENGGCDSADCETCNDEDEV